MLPREPRSAQEACDVVAITHLAVAYAEAVSRGEIAEACQTYAVDGELHSPTTEPAIGRAAVTETIERTCADLEFVFQTVHQGMVTVDGDTARARFPITEWARRRSDSRPIQFLGVYDDECVRTADGWRFARRTLLPKTIGKPEGLAGRVLPLSPPAVWT
ncbi:nuclear transport factor 2 family protein [Mycolicibacterium flavescens]|uniref:Polyketide cyclase n=1 Tax=Mycolicibacterium flavescens TaxID=1776 RepID=A0A1E3RDH2_MYCFV|nr:nuclear transport factor 2 family protein [Mycolicibacterium flavescens]MCV7282397.1 nuclear transport factor 2 family protein [Mycolicibacterium flavescens]ODQ87920.1 polyketide cyclase [Mycolicibacterium flavescens]